MEAAAHDKVIVVFSTSAEICSYKRHHVPHKVPFILMQTYLNMLFSVTENWTPLKGEIEVILINQMRVDDSGLWKAR